MVAVDVVGNFWIAIDSQNWALLTSCLAPDFVRIGMSGEEADINRGRDAYVKRASGNIGTTAKYSHEVFRSFYSPDRRLAVSETIETIAVQADQEPAILNLLNIFEINHEGLLSKLSLYWKTPLAIPDSWRAVPSLPVPRP